MNPNSHFRLGSGNNSDMTKIDRFSLATVPVEQYANGQLLGSATAFVWKLIDKHYLVTNWHVVTGKNATNGKLMLTVRPEILRAYFNSGVHDYWKVQHDIRLRDDRGDPVWYVHPHFETKRIDLAAIPLNIATGDAEIDPHPINLIKSDIDLEVSIGMDVFVLGYPFGYSPPGYPVWKRGSIASEPQLVHLADAYLLVDTASRPGMSGAPVIRRSWGTHSLASGGTSSNSTPQSKFVGVYSGRRKTEDSSDAQLGMVWMRRDVEDIVTMQKLDE
jgi:Trypsin-like peptidase domain